MGERWRTPTALLERRPSGAAALHSKYIVKAEAAGRAPLSPPAKIPKFTHSAHSGFVLKLDRHFAKEGGWYTGAFSVKPRR